VGGRAVERAVGADEVCDGNGCRSPRSSTAVFCGPSLAPVRAGMTTVDELRQRAHEGSTPAQVRLGVTLLEDSDGHTGLPEAFRWLTAASDKGASRAMFHLGVMYYRGLHVSSDPDRARRLFERAAEAGEFLAAVWLARILANGEAGAVDAVGACHWYRAALSQAKRVSAPGELEEARVYLAQHEPQEP